MAPGLSESRSPMKAPPEISTPSAYLAALPDARRSELRRIHTTIRKAAPGLKPFLVHGMLGYGPIRYRYASGREGDTGVICLASQKHHIGLYLCGCDENGPLARQWGPKLGRTNVGVGCIRFKKLADVDLDALADIARRSAAWAQSQNC